MNCKGEIRDVGLKELLFKDGEVKAKCALESDSVDISQKFFSECSRLCPGELAIASNFTLADAMSALELMDPRMDIGMCRIDELSEVDKLISSLQLNSSAMELPELIATMDAMLATFVSWTEGSSLGQTILTCILIHLIDDLVDTTLSAYCCGIVELVHLCRRIVEYASVYDEEDFNFRLFNFPASVSDNFTGIVGTVELSLKLKIEEKGNDPKLLSAVLCRIRFLHSLYQSLKSLSRNDLNEALSSTSIQSPPEIEEGAMHIHMAMSCLEEMISTIDLGLQPAERDDGNYNWLRAFEPNVSKKLLPPALPRKVKLKNRLCSQRILVRLCSRIQQIATDVSTHISNVETIVKYFQYFCANDSCVLSRSLLQIVYFPLDDNIMGCVPLSSTILTAIRSRALSTVIDNMISSDSQLHYKDFLNDAVRVFMGVIQMLGHNLARQRERIVACIEDFAALCHEANRVDIVYELSDYSLSSFVTYNTMLLIEYHFYLSTKLDLLAPYEYPYVYWYLNEIVYRRLLQILQHYRNSLVFELQNVPKLKRKSGKKKLPDIRREAELKDKISSLQDLLKHYDAKRNLSEACFQTAVGMISINKISFPDRSFACESLRFELRMNPFSSLSRPLHACLHASYDQYALLSRLSEVESAVVSFSCAHDAFAIANTYFIQCKVDEDLNDNYIKICKYNMIVLRILQSESCIDKNIRFVRNDLAPLFPMLKID